MTHECDGCRSDTRDDHVRELNGARLCEACQWAEFDYGFDCWVDEFNIARIFPQQSDMAEAA